MSNFYSFGEACRKARLRKGWTYLQAMMHINGLCNKREMICNERSIVRWEKGEGLPKIEPTKAMAIVYDEPDLIRLRLESIEFAKLKATCVGAQMALGKNL